MFITVHDDVILLFTKFVTVTLLFHITRFFNIGSIGLVCSNLLFTILFYKICRPMKEKETKPQL